ncbi:hypothetical protein HYC85_015180 [Camellia sinensis]|uniref:Geranylgeranyl diphosphate reductase, chloroplastic n=1 Tax=Camellia sinensis TaxID=4442 RepID=A0A7J7H8E9_CAMSI|nr:hypothetical protein HYC85_015180 [Camellia sinensis]
MVFHSVQGTYPRTLEIFREAGQCKPRRQWYGTDFPGETVEAGLRIGQEGVLIADLPQSYPSSRAKATLVMTDTWPSAPSRNLRATVVGGGPAGGTATQTLAKGSIETYRCKLCSSIIPLCMVGEFDLPLDIIHRRVTKMKMISPSNVAVDIGQTLKPHKYIGMVRREILDSYLRDRAASSGATVINGLFLKMDKPKTSNKPYVLHYTGYDSKTGDASEWWKLEVDAMIGADEANSRVAKSIEAGHYEYAIVFQERNKIPDEKMRYYENLAKMYVGDDASPDFYGWVFPKCDHVAVGTGTMTHKGDIKKFQTTTRQHAHDKILGSRIIRVEAHPIPEHPRLRQISDRVALVNEAARYVMKCSNRGDLFRNKQWEDVCGSDSVGVGEWEEDGRGRGPEEVLGEVGQDILADV